MQVRVFREACCAQDDQMGPLESTYRISSEATLKDLVEEIVESRFLQYSSSHIAMLGEVGRSGVGVVKVFSPYYCDGKEAQFLVPPEQRLGSLIGENALSFRFRFVFD